MGYRIKNCTVCKKEFDYGRHKDKKTCSKECLKTHMNNIKEDRIKKSKEAIKAKYGVDHASKIPGWYDKVKKTKKERYGDETFNNRDKAKDTMKKEYGVTNSMKLSENVKKSKNTKKEKYGDENFNNREKAKKTNIDKLGVDHHLKTEKSLSKMKQTNLEKYGVEWGVLTEESKKGLVDKNQKKYGSDYYFSSNVFLNKAYKNKLMSIEEVLISRDLEFIDENGYNKIREKLEGGKLKYLKYKLRCKKCNNEFEARMVDSSMVCRVCFPPKDGTSLQNEIGEFLSENKINIESNNRTIIAPGELDFYLPDYNLAIEVNGNYWHSELSGGKDKKYHINKTKLCNEKGIKLIHVFEDEWLLKKDIVKSRILNSIQKNKNKVYARKCFIRKVENDEKSYFLNNNHIQGDSRDSIRYALEYNNEIVSIMTFSKQRKALGQSHSEDNWEMIRFCSKIGSNVIGGFSKLLKHFIKTHNPKSIVTYADCRWSGINPDDTVYNKNGFEFIHISRPSFFYIKRNNCLQRYHRFSLRKDVLLKKGNGNKSMSGWDLAQIEGYDRIWDCGSMKFVLNNS